MNISYFKHAWSYWIGIHVNPWTKLRSQKDEETFIFILYSNQIVSLQFCLIARANVCFITEYFSNAAATKLHKTFACKLKIQFAFHTDFLRLSPQGKQIKDVSSSNRIVPFRTFMQNVCTSTMRCNMPNLVNVCTSICIKMGFFFASTASVMFCTLLRERMGKLFCMHEQTWVLHFDFCSKIALSKYTNNNKREFHICTYFTFRGFLSFKR